MSTYTLELTENQLQAISKACEICARLKSGQILSAISLLELNDIHGKPVDTYELGKSVEPIFKLAMGLEPHAAWGIGYSDKIDTLYDIHEVIRHRLAWDDAHDKGIIVEGEPRKWPEMMTVDFDEPMKCGLEPLPKLVRNNNAPQDD